MAGTAEGGTRERRRDRTRVEILDTARALVVERGQDALSLREVARRAGYSPAALYRYFDGKDALLAALGVAALQVLGGYLEGVPASMPAPERLVALAVAYGRFAEENPDQLALVFDRMRAPAAPWSHYVAVAWPFTLIVEAVAEGSAAGALEAPDAASAAFGLWALAHGAAALRAAHLRDVGADYGSMERAAYETYVLGLMKDDAR
jgi:AcrR family transcriptional regulator